MSLDPVVMNAIIFVGISGALLAVLLMVTGFDRRLGDRLRDLSGNSASALRHRRKTAKKASSVTGGVKALLQKLGDKAKPHSESKRMDLQLRLIQAGFYSTSAPTIFLGAKTALTVLAAGGSFYLIQLELLSFNTSLLIGAGVTLGCMLGPEYWVGWKKKKRQVTLNGSLPDFLDLIVVCIETGLSFESALQRVCDELRFAHPLFAGELSIVQQEISLGRTADTALTNFYTRSGLDVVKSLATIVQQARRFGSNMSAALRTHADTLRLQREQRAEEMAQKAAVKILFPTMLFIFPALFVVLVGPAAIDLAEKMAGQ